MLANRTALLLRTLQSHYAKISLRPNFLDVGGLNSLKRQQHTSKSKLDVYEEWIQVVRHRQISLDINDKEHRDEQELIKLINETKEFVNEFNEKYQNGEIDKFWTRKSNKAVLSVLLIELNNNNLADESTLKYLKTFDIPICDTMESMESMDSSGYNNKKKRTFALIRGCNSEISLPGGSVCAERASIVQAISNVLTIKLSQFRMIAVIDPSFEIKEIQPCGVCEEWILKFQEESPNFKIVSFPTANDFTFIKERFPAKYKKPIISSFNKYIKNKKNENENEIELTPKEIYFKSGGIDISDDISDISEIDEMVHGNKSINTTINAMWTCELCQRPNEGLASRCTGCGWSNNIRKRSVPYRNINITKSICDIMYQLDENKPNRVFLARDIQEKLIQNSENENENNEAISLLPSLISWFLEKKVLIKANDNHGKSSKRPKSYMLGPDFTLFQQFFQSAKDLTN